MINPFKKIEVNHYTLRHPRVGEEAQGLQLAHVTDIHLGRWVKPGHVRQLAAFVNGHAPDLTALTGDYVGYSARDIAPCAEALGELRGQVYATLGNHDHWASTQATWDAFAGVGIPVLTNRSELVRTTRGHALRVIGVDDAVTRHHDLDEAFAEAGAQHFQLVLSHVPELGPPSAARGGHLILSGHTHGLQFNVPNLAAPLAARLGMTYIEGAYALEGALLYVSRGLGSASWPWRYRAAPELAFFRLAHGDAPSLTRDGQEFLSLEQPPRARRWRRKGLDDTIQEES
jgi:predicted MPP superfamily phosphohydrolase